MNWFTLTPSYNHVTLVLSTHYLACGWIQQAKPNSPLVLKAYDKIALPNHVDAHSIFNPTAIGTFIATFLAAYSIKNPLLSCAFTSPIVTEKLVTRAHATPHPSSLMITHTPHTLWDYHYLYPTDTNDHVFYVCAITQPFLLQYKLIALKYQLPLLTTTSQVAALLHLYRYVHAHAFRASQLGIDMQQCQHNPERLFTLDMLNRIITIPPHTTITPAHEAPLLLTMCGLFISERLP